MTDTVAGLRIAAASAEQVSALAAFVPSRHRARLRRGALPPSMRLVGAWASQRPIGAALAVIDEAAATTESLYVLPDRRGDGIGRAMLAALGRACAAAGAETLTAAFPDSPRFAAIRGVLRAEDWPEPALVHRQFEAGDGIRAAPMLAGSARPRAPYTLVTHGELRPRDRRDLVRIAAGLAPGLDPLRQEDAVVGEASLYLRRGDRIVGWSVHRYFAPGITVLPSAWIAPSERGGGLGGWLGIRSIGAALDAGYTGVRFVVHVDNAPMLRIVERDVLPYGTTEIGLLAATRALTEPAG